MTVLMLLLKAHLLITLMVMMATHQHEKHLRIPAPPPPSPSLPSQSGSICTHVQQRVTSLILFATQPFSLSFFHLMTGLTNFPEYACTFNTASMLPAAVAAAATAASNAHANNVNGNCK
jgi:hypothetical protein